MRRISPPRSIWWIELNAERLEAGLERAAPAPRFPAMHGDPQKSSHDAGNPVPPKPEPAPDTGPKPDPKPGPQPPAGDPPPRDPEKPQRLPGKPTRPVEEPPDKPNRETSG